MDKFSTKRGDTLFLNHSIPSYPKDIHQIFQSWSITKRLIFTALMASLATILQSAGGLLPGIGYAISPLATAPILLGSLISFRSGTLIYSLTICLLMVIQPSELLIFPFTTGLLGIGLGWTFISLNKRSVIIVMNGFLLLIGICIPLYGIGFPVFGSAVSSSFHMSTLLIIFAFSLLYSLLWVNFGLFLLRKIRPIIGVE